MRSLKCAFKNKNNERFFMDNGYLVLDRIIPESSLSVLKSFYLKNKALYDSALYASTLGLQDNYAHRKEANDIFEQHTSNIVNELFIDYEQYYGGLGIKAASGKESLLEIHQDITMVPYGNCRPGITLWFALDDMDIENGCLQVYPRSHKFNRKPRAPYTPFAYEEYIDEICSNRLIDVFSKKKDRLY